MLKLSVITFALACFMLVLPVNAYSQSAQDIPVFKSKAAISAMKDLESDLKKIEAKWQADVALANTEMREKLESALEHAVKSKDFTEIKAISSFLETNAKPGKNVTVDPIVGPWIHHNGNRTIFDPDGFVTLRGSTIGLWQKRKDGVYFVAYLKSFGRGVSDEIRIKANGKSCDLIASDGRKLNLNRPKGR